MNKNTSIEEKQKRSHGKIKEIRSLKPSQWFLLLLLAVGLYMAFHLVSFFIHPLILAILLASIFHPLQQRICKLLKGKKNLSAFISCLLVVSIIILPLSLLSVGMVNQGIKSVNAVRLWIEQGNLTRLFQSEQLHLLRQLGERYLASFPFKFNQLEEWMVTGSQYAGQFLLSKGGALVSNLGNLFIRFWIMIFILFYLLRDGKKWLERLLYLFPLSKSQEDILIGRIKGTGKSVLVGNFLTAIAQGGIGGLGLWIAGITPLFWASLMAVTSFIPLVGTGLVWLPAVSYLLIIRKFSRAIFLFFYCLIILSPIDNLLRPFLMSKQKGLSLPPLLIFLAVLGGIKVFGLLGIIYGPMIFSLVSSLLYLYEVEFSSFLNSQDQ